jgi:hypothetical protein
MGINVGAGWRINEGWYMEGGPVAGTQIVTLTGIELTTITGALFITI